MTWFRIALALGLIASLAGCGGGSDSPPPTAPAGSVNEAESNDFTPQSVGTLSATDIVVAGSTSSANDVDLYRVTASGPVALFVSLDWGSASDLELSISDANGIFVRHVDTAGHPESCRLPGLAAGTYTVRVGSFTNTATNYTLTLGQR